MKKSFILGSLLFFSFNSFANITLDKSGKVKAPQSKDAYCQNIKNEAFVRSLPYSADNQLYMQNKGGLFNGGVCWWHSMFLRNALNLSVFLPSQQKPSQDEARLIISDLIVANGVVEIPGYQNIYQFSRDFSDELQSALNTWQITDGGLGFGWVRGISGKTSIAPEKLQEMMDETYELVTKKNHLAYQMLQMPGVDAHAWLVADVVKTTSGYSLEVIDSNYPGRVRKIPYVRGTTQLSEYGGMVPYTGRNSFNKSAYKSAAHSYCKLGITAKDKREESANY